MTLILGVDPGKATGMALYDLDTCKVVRTYEAQNGIYGFREGFEMFFSSSLYPPAYTVCEGFTLRSSNKFVADLSGVEIIGWLKGQDFCKEFPEPSTHMTLTKLRKNKDDYKQSVITKMMKDAKMPIGKGHNRMGLSVAVWFAAKRLKHMPTLEMLKPRGEVH